MDFDLSMDYSVITIVLAALVCLYTMIMDILNHNKIIHSAMMPGFGAMIIMALAQEVKRTFTFADTVRFSSLALLAMAFGIWIFTGSDLSEVFTRDIIQKVEINYYSFYFIPIFFIFSGSIFFPNTFQRSLNRVTCCIGSERKIQGTESSKKSAYQKSCIWHRVAFRCSVHCICMVSAYI